MLLLITTSLMPGWKWEKLDTGEGPPICLNSEYQYFHLAYDPNIKSLVFTYWNQDINKIDTWIWDGVEWTFDCTHDPSSGQDDLQFESNQMFYDELNNTMIDIRMYVCNSNPPHPYQCDLLCKKDESTCWQCFTESEATLLSAYDTDRKRAIMMSNYFDHIFEWDGDQIHEIQLSSYYHADRVAYDESSQRIIMHFRGRGQTHEYDGVNIQTYDGEILIGDTAWDMAYNPILSRVVTAFIGGGTYIYKNHKWNRLCPGNCGLSDFSYFERLVYFPPTNQFLLITNPLYTQDCLAFYKLVRKHEIPFNKQPE